MFGSNNRNGPTQNSKNRRHVYVHAKYNCCSLITFVVVSGNEYHGNSIRLMLRRVRRYQRGNQNIRKSKKDRQHNGKKKKDKRATNDLQSIYIKLQIE